jgi:RHS repeat-associated protein
VDIDDQAAGNYDYDLIGNLKKDVSEGIDEIHWTVYGKIHQIVKSDGSININYGYDAGGNRTTKIVSGSADTTTFYVRDAQGNVLAVYTKQNTDDLKWSEQDLYGSSRLGLWKWDTIVPTSPPIVDGSPIYDSLLLGSRTYELTNHLGNVLSTISDKKIGNDSSSVVNYYIAEVLSQNDYYPFGMLMPGRQYIPSPGSGLYRYGFNGKENDNEVKGEGNQVEYGERYYDPRIGRFYSVDPLQKKYPGLTSYQFASNTPISAIDLDGKEAYIPWNGKGLSGTPMDHYFADLKGTKLWLKAMGTEIVAGGAIAMDIFVTKGWMTKTLLASEIFGAFEHNRAKTLEGQIAQNQRSREVLADAFITFGMGKVLGIGLNVTSEISELAANRFNFAKQFYKSAGYSPQKFLDHARGIDLANKVFETELKTGDILEQWRKVDLVTGETIPSDYYTLPGADLKKLGIDVAGRVKVTLRLEKDTKFLQSTTADIEDTWTTPGKTIEVKGGETQLFQVGVKANVIK